MSALYPLVFKPILKRPIWGGDKICKFKNLKPELDDVGESWEISHVEGNYSIVDNGELEGKSLDELIKTYKEKLVGKKVWEKYGDKFPLLIKFIDAKKPLSIQVHPNDELAEQRHGTFGKTEMWYIISADKGAYLFSGFKKQMDPEKYIKSLKDDTFIDYLSKYEVKAGDVFFLPAGRVHAIGPGCFLTEIQETSDITYRIYDYKRKDKNGKERELHTKLAKDAIDYTVYPDYKLSYTPEKDVEQNLVTCKHFTTNVIVSDKKIDLDFSKRESFTLLICMNGKLSIRYGEGAEMKIKYGQSLLIPAEIKSLSLLPEEGEYKVLETFIA